MKLSNMTYLNQLPTSNRTGFTLFPMGPIVALCVLCTVGAGCGQKESKQSAPAPRVTVTDGGTYQYPDASKPDASKPSGLSLQDLYGDELCTFAEEDVMAFGSHTRAVTVSLAARDDDVAFAYHNADGDRTVRVMGLSGPARLGAEIESAQASSGVRIVDANGGFAVSWWEGSGLHAQRFGVDGHAQGAPVLLGSFADAFTTNMLSDSTEERIYVGVRTGEQLTVGSYPEGNPSAVEFDQSVAGEPGLVHAVLASVKGEPSVAWSNGGGVYLSSLDNHAPLPLAEGGSGFFDLAGGPESGALAYSRLLSGVQLVAYQPFEGEGVRRLSPRTVQRAPAELRDVSVVPFGRGFALAYRSLVSRDFPNNTIRVAFMNQTGELVYEGEIGTTSRAGGPTDIVATADGHVVVVWNDTDDNQVHLRRLNCPIALKLCNVR